MQKNPTLPEDITKRYPIVVANYNHAVGMYPQWSYQLRMATSQTQKDLYTQRMAEYQQAIDDLKQARLDVIEWLKSSQFHYFYPSQTIIGSSILVGNPKVGTVAGPAKVGYFGTRPPVSYNRSLLNRQVYGLPINTPEKVVYQPFQYLRGNLIRWPDGTYLTGEVMLFNLGAYWVTCLALNEHRARLKVISESPNDFTSLLANGYYQSKFFHPVAPSSVNNRVAELSWLSRPPLTDLEIKLMHSDEIVLMYYNLMQIKADEAGNWRYFPPYQAVSGSLGDFFLDYEIRLRDRIYRLRPDLHWVTDGTNRYEVLVEPKKLVPQVPEGSPWAMVVSVVGGIVGVVCPILGLVLQAVAVAMQTVQTIQTSQQMNELLAKADNMSRGILLGTQLLGRGPQPQPTAGELAWLRNYYASWQQKVAGYDLSIFKPGGQAHNVWGPSAGLIQANGGHQHILETWKPFTKCFLSDYVRSMVTSSSTPVASSGNRYPQSGNLLTPYL